MSEHKKIAAGAANTSDETQRKNIYQEYNTYKEECQV